MMCPVWSSQCGIMPRIKPALGRQCRAMPISVEVMARMLRQPNETEQEGIARACTEFAKSFLDSKASEECVSCIKAVEYVRLEGLSSIKKCAICYQEYYAGTVVDCLPCSHVYHANGIISQLAREANFCIRCHGAYRNRHFSIAMQVLTCHWNSLVAMVLNFSFDF